MKKIAKDEELTVHYGVEYFNDGACRCESCLAETNEEVSETINGDDEVSEIREECGEEANMEFTFNHLETINEDDEVSEIREATGEEPNMQFTFNHLDTINEDDEEGSNHLDEAANEEVEAKCTGRKIKYSSNPECLMCHKTTTRIDRHLATHSEVINKKEIQFLKDFYRTKDGPKNSKVYDCVTCFRRFVSILRHKCSMQCDGKEIVRAENFFSKR